jgi:hypothetical protein
LLIKEHPTTKKTFIRLFFTLLVTLFTLTGIPIYLADHGFSQTMDAIGLYLVGGIFVFFIICYICLHYWLKHVACPACGAQTITKRTCADLPEAWSARCETCEIIWDLGIGNKAE